MSFLPNNHHQGACELEENMEASRDVVLLRHNANDDELQSSLESASPSSMGPEFEGFEDSPEIDVITNDVADDHHGLFADLSDGGLLQGLDSIPATANAANSINCENIISSANSINSAESPCPTYDPRFTTCQVPVVGYGQIAEQGESVNYQRQNTELSALLTSSTFDPAYTRLIPETSSSSVVTTTDQGSIWRPTPWQVNCEEQLFNMERCDMQNPVNQSREELVPLHHENTVIDLTESTDDFPSEDRDSDLNFSIDQHPIQHQQNPPQNIAQNSEEIFPFQTFEGCAPVTQYYQVEKDNQTLLGHFPFTQQQNIDNPKQYYPTSYPEQSQQLASNEEFIHDWPKFQLPLSSVESANVQTGDGCDLEATILSAEIIQEVATNEPATSDVSLAVPSLFNPGPVRFEKHPQSVPQVKLTNRDLWMKFFEIGTEMIITKAGRRMFPAVKLSIKNLDPNKNYALAIDILPVDNNRYRYVYHSSQWMAAGTTEASAAPCTYFHPDSPARGDVWMQQAISFDKLKLTNHEMNRKGHVILHSMHKYQPRVHVIECAITRHSELEHLVAPNRRVDDVTRNDVTTTVFPECAFTTVTAYQNQQITKLKIDRNPFAKGFRDNSKNWKPKPASDENKLKRTWNGDHQASVQNNTNTPTRAEHSVSPSSNHVFMSNYQTIPVPEDFNQRDLYEPEQKLVRSSLLNVPTSNFDPQHDLQDLSMMVPGNAAPYQLGGFPVNPDDPACFTNSEPSSTHQPQLLDYSSAYSVSSYGSLESTNSNDDQLAFSFQPATPATLH